MAYAKRLAEPSGLAQVMSELKMRLLADNLYVTKSFVPVAFSPLTVTMHPAVRRVEAQSLGQIHSHLLKRGQRFCEAREKGLAWTKMT
jgi:hypothetical protein